MNDNEPVLVYDGICALCNHAVRFVLKRDRTIRFAPLQGAYAEELLRRYPELRAIDSILFVTGAAEQERIQTRSDAALAILEHIGWPRPVVASLRIIPHPIRDLLYDVIARTRYRVFGRMSSCPVPPPEARERFIE